MIKLSKELGDNMLLFNHIKRRLKAYTKWKRFYTKEERNQKAPNKTIYEMFLDYAIKNPNDRALNYFGKHITYKNMMDKIDDVADSFMEMGAKRYDIITIIMPNTPEALYAFYATSKIGAVANMIHPLSSETEILNCLKNTESKYVVVVDASYDKMVFDLKDTKVEKIIGVSAGVSMPLYLKIGYFLKAGRKFKTPHKEKFISWSKFLKMHSARQNIIKERNVKDTAAVILQSGGTTGVSKGIVISNGNFASMCIQAGIFWKGLEPHDKILAIMPCFHGFGLALSIHSPLCMGVENILLPRFDARTFDKLLDKYKPNFVFGVPTLFEALVNSNNVKNLDLSCIKYIVSGGDSLPASLQDRLNIFLKEHGSNATVSQGYGMTECLAGCIVNLGISDNNGCIGVPGPHIDVKICEPFSQKEVKDGESGEICISGPTVMLGYLNNEEETNNALQVHSDGFTWLHTGDIGHISKEDGLVYYEQRLKRMIISSGYNVYPKQIEEVIESHEAVLSCVVVGIPHPYKVEVAKACIVLKNDVLDTPFLRANIKKYCEKHLAKYEQPYKYDFRKALPRTKLGKIDFKKLQDEN